MLDLDAYLERIGLSGRPALAEVHRAHATAIPFENLDPQRGVPVSLAVADLERKLVRERRGGYCFEQNLLLRAALEALGARVELLLARVRYGAEPGVVRPRTHLVLRVHADGGEWLADVGFARATPLEPLPFAVGAEHEQAGWRYRLREGREGELVLQMLEDGGFADLYAFSLAPVPLIDVELSNWWTSTHPASAFVTGLIVAANESSGTRVTLSDWGELALAERTPERRSAMPVERSQVPALLASRFGLAGFELDERCRLVRAA